ncbi:MAG TPA: hypothetical protein VMI33_00375 [Streptosporangiaceae bacterium]|nr:hypothetical protein [Streptosporangiaceae bacterium]
MRTSRVIPASDDDRRAARRWRRRTLVLSDRPGPGLLAGRPGGIADQALARALGPWLDRRLAAGRSPDSTRLLAARALDLVSAAARQELAESWEHLLEVAEGGRAPRPGRAPLCRDRVVAAGPELREMVRRLRTPLPVTVRGVAAASVLLTDGAGPVYNRHADPGLPQALRLVTAELDPRVPLFAPA